MSTPPHDDRSAGSVTQGGGRDADGPGPARVRGRSIWWIAAVGVIAAVTALFWLFSPHPRAPAEAGKSPVAAAASASSAAGGGPASGPSAP